jgi:hypothetical protein
MEHRAGLFRIAECGFRIFDFEIRNSKFEMWVLLYALCSMLYAALDTLGISVNEILPRSHAWPLLPY